MVKFGVICVFGATVKRVFLHLPFAFSQTAFKLSSYFLLLSYREVQLDLTPEIEVFHLPFEICHTKNRKRSINPITK